MNKIIIIILLLSSAHNTIFAQQDKESERLRLSYEFAMAFKNDLPNEEIIKKYCIAENYFKNDTSKRYGDEWMNDLKKSYKLLPEKDFDVLPYVGHEDDFAVLYDGVKQKRQFKLFTLDHQTFDIDLNDLYVIKKKSNKESGNGLFLLYNNDNKVISFAGIVIGYRVSLTQF